MKTKHNMHIAILCLIAMVIMTFVAGCTEEQVTQYIDEHPDEVANYVASHPDQINQYIAEHPEVMNNITVPTTEPLIQQTVQQQTEEVSPTPSEMQSETTIPTSIPTTTETETPTPIITTSPPTQTSTFTQTATVVPTTIVTTIETTEALTTVPTTNPTTIVMTATPTPIPITMGADGLPAIATVRHSWRGHSSNSVFVSAEMMCSPNGFLTNPDITCTITGSSHEIINSDGTVHKSYGSDSGISFSDSFKIHDNGDGTYTTPNEVTDFIMKNKTSKRVFIYSQLSETLTISGMDWITFNHEV